MPILVIFFLLLPTSEYSVRFLLEVPFYVLILFFKKSIKSIYGFEYLLIYIFLVFMFQALYTINVHNILDIARIFSLISFITFVRCLNRKQILYIPHILMVIHILAQILNYIDSGQLLWSLNVNNLNLDQSYGRNSGIFSSIAIAGFFSLSYLIYLAHMRSSSTLLNILGSVLGIFSLFASGSKVNYVLFILALLIFLIYNLVRTFIHLKLHKNFIGLFCIVTLFGYISYDILVNFEVSYQIVKLLSILETGSSSSLSGRLQIWNSYFAVQIESFIFLLFGVPKSVLSDLNSTFDSDYIWVCLRLGIIGVIISGALLINYVVEMSGKLSKSISFYMMICAMLALVIGITIDPQGLLVLVLFLTIFKVPRSIETREG